MRKRLLTALAILSMNEPALAQQTDCRWVGSTWTCQTKPDIWQQNQDNLKRQNEQFQNLLRNLDQQQQRNRAEYDAKVQASHDAAVSEVKSVISRKLREGDCKGAIELALLLNDIELASQVKTFCNLPSPEK